MASFSFGVGLATWPVLLLLAWSLRLSWRSFALITVAAVTAAIIFLLLPPHVRGPAGLRTFGISPITPTLELSYLCWLLSAPIFDAVNWGARASTPFVLSFFALMVGIVALVVASREIVLTAIRRDLTRSSLGLIGIALMAFNLTAIAVIVNGRSDHFGAMPFEVAFLDGSAPGGGSACWIVALDAVASLPPCSRCFAFGSAIPLPNRDSLETSCRSGSSRRDESGRRGSGRSAVTCSGSDGRNVLGLSRGRTIATASIRHVRRGFSGLDWP